MDRRLLLEYVRVTEAAAIACSRQIGKGDKNAADDLATRAMRRALQRIPAQGTVVIGEGEMDEAPMLYIGEKVGPTEGEDLPQVDIAVDPLEGTNLVAKGMPGALAVIAVSAAGSLLNAPDMYMDKIVTGPKGRGVVDLDRTPRQNLLALADAMHRRPSEMTVVLLDRPRHESMVRELREAGARVWLISDGDVNPSVAAGLPRSEVDMCLGTGGAPEGVLAAAALKCLGGEFQGRLVPEDDEERARARSMGLADPEMKLGLDDVVRGHCLFAASGVTGGPLLPGVKVGADGRVEVHSIGLRSASGSIRFFETRTRTDHLPIDEI